MKTILSLLLVINTCLFAQTELPFLTFSDATLSVSTKTIVGKVDGNQFAYYPLLSLAPPRRLQRNRHIPLALNQPMDGEILLIVDDTVGLVTHYFHFMEHLVGIWNFLTYHDPDSIKNILFAFDRPSENDHDWYGPNNTTRVLLTSLFPNATIGLLSDLPVDHLEAKKIHVSSRLRSHGIPESTYNNMNGSARFDYHPERLQQMRDRLFDKMGIVMESPEDFLRITYCKRTTGRVMDGTLETLLLDRIKQQGWPVKVVDFAYISFHEQLQTIANTDLFISIHGNGLTHLLFLPDHATVLEYYQGGESAFFRLFAQIRGLSYYGNSQQRWVTEDYKSLTNKAPFQDTVTNLDLEGTLDLISQLTNRLKVVN